jgi:hypothetical protein
MTNLGRTWVGCVSRELESTSLTATKPVHVRNLEQGQNRGDDGGGKENKGGTTKDKMKERGEEGGISEGRKGE